MKVGWVLCLVTALSSCASFEFERDEDAGTITIREGDEPVLTYRYGDQLPEGVPESRKRSSYIHPIYGLDGTVLTEDFPKDHLHHRGLSLMWPVMTVDGKPCELWHIRGIRSIFDRVLEQHADADGATLRVRNHWTMSDQRKVAEETWTLRVHPRTGGEGNGARAIDVHIEILTRDVPITLQGEGQKGYGGLALRLQFKNRRKNTSITTDAGIQKGDRNHARFAWADFSADFEGSKGPSGIAIFVGKTHPGYPTPWSLRYYGDLNVAWPGVQKLMLEPKSRLQLDYRIYVHQGVASAASLASACANWQADPSSTK